MRHGNEFGGNYRKAQMVKTFIATSFGFALNVWTQIFDGPTIYNRVADAGYTWGAYYFDDNDLAEFSQVKALPTTQGEASDFVRARYAEHGTTLAKAAKQQMRAKAQQAKKR